MDAANVFSITYLRVYSQCYAGDFICGLNG